MSPPRRVRSVANSLLLFLENGKQEEVVEGLMYRLRDSVRKFYGRKSPNLDIIDSEKRVVDTLGRPMITVIHPENIHDSKGAVPVIKRLVGRFSNLKEPLADGGIEVRW